MHTVLLITEIDLPMPWSVKLISQISFEIYPGQKQGKQVVVTGCDISSLPGHFLWCDVPNDSLFEIERTRKWSAKWGEATFDL